MVFSEATIAMPIVAAYALHKRDWVGRPERRFNDVLDKELTPA
jgi:deoxyhypusine synthase